MRTDAADATGVADGAASDTDDAAIPTSAEASDADSTDGSPPDTDDGAPDDADPEPAPAGESRATVTLDGTTYEFSPGGLPEETTCDPNAFGSFFGVTLWRVGDDGEIIGTDIVDMSLVPPDVDPETAGFESLVTVTVDGTSRVADPAAGELNGVPRRGRGASTSTPSTVGPRPVPRPSSSSTRRRASRRATTWRSRLSRGPSR